MLVMLDVCTELCSSLCKLIYKIIIKSSERYLKNDFKYNIKRHIIVFILHDCCAHYLFLQQISKSMNHRLYSGASCGCMYRYNAVPLKLPASFQSILLPVITSPYWSSLHVTLPVLCLVNAILWPPPPCAFSTYLWLHISPSNC